MFQFYIHSLTFKPAFQQKKSLFISIQTEDGKERSTEISQYDQISNLTFFGELIDMPLNYIQAKTFFIVYINERIAKASPIGSSYENIHIAKKVIEFDEGNLEKMAHTVVTLNPCANLPQNLQILLKLGLKVFPLNNFKAASPTLQEEKESGSTKKKQSPGHIKLPSSESNIIKDLFVKPFLNEVRDFSTKDNGWPELLKATEINNEYIKHFTPIVYLSNYLRELWNWKSPTHTIVFGIAVTVFLKFSNYFICGTILLLYCNTAYFANMVVHLKKNRPKDQSLIEKNLARFNRYKSNLAFIQKDQKTYVQKYKELKKLLFSDDKTEIIHHLYWSRKFYPLIFITFCLINTLDLIIIGFWLSLLYNTTYGFASMKFAHQIVDMIMSKIDKTLNYFMKKLNFYEEVHPPTSPKAISPDSQIKKTFIIYENQRWWMGKGWGDYLVPGERKKYTDDTGYVELNFEYYSLPGDDWKWTGDWKVERDEGVTDMEGWSYAVDFTKPFHNKNNTFDMVRRRKWIRSCIFEK